MQVTKDLHEICLKYKKNPTLFSVLAFSPVFLKSPSFHHNFSTIHTRLELTSISPGSAIVTEDAFNDSTKEKST